MERLFRTHSRRLQAFYDLMPAPVQDMLTSIRGWSLTRNRYAPSMYALCRELRSHETWDAEQIRTYQLTTVRDAVNNARTNVPYYSDYPALKWNTLATIRELPVLSREDVREHASAFLSRTVSESEIIKVRTTGTTGASLTVGQSGALMRTSWAFHMRQRYWAAVHPRSWRITFFGSRVTPPARKKPPYWVFNIPERQILMSIFHLSENTADNYISFLNEHEGLILEGFPSVLCILADFILRRQRNVRMRAIFTDGEPLYGFVRNKIETAFQSKVYDTYGNTELCGLIQECEYGRMHLAPEFGYVEILDDHNCPVREGEEGYFVWTSLANRVMPLIRYRIGDRGCWATGACGCRRAFPLIVPTITRDSDLLQHPDGRIFSPRALNQLLKNLSSVRFCQFVQQRDDRVVVRAVASAPNAELELAGVCHALSRVLGAGITVGSELAHEPIIRAGGKMPLIVRANGSRTGLQTAAQSGDADGRVA